METQEAEPQPEVGVAKTALEGGGATPVGVSSLTPPPQRDGVGSPAPATTAEEAAADGEGWAAALPPVSGLQGPTAPHNAP